MKALLFFIIIFLVFIAIKFVLKRVNAIRTENTEQENETQQTEEPPKKMVSCQQCGVHLPLNDALQITSIDSKEILYACCKEHS